MMRYYHVMADDNEKPATKADLSLLATKIELDRLDKKVDGLDKKIDRVAASLVNTQADVRRIEQFMATKKDIERILGAIYAFAKKSENHDNAVALHGHVLTEVQVGLKGHESRLKTIESARS